MKKRIALLVYPEFSLQEVSNLMNLFRWKYDTLTDVIYPQIQAVKSEEGIYVMPVKTCADFCVDDYDCLILPGCSDFCEAIRNQEIKGFLSSLKNNHDFIIGAICAGPLFLAQANLLQGKKYTASLFVEMRELFSFIEEENFVAAPVVEDGNIITAIGGAFNEFAVKIARKLGYSCPDIILTGYADTGKEEYYYAHLTKEAKLEFKKEFHDFIVKNRRN